MGEGIEKIRDFGCWLDTPAGFRKALPFLVATALASAFLYIKLMPPSKSYRDYLQLHEQVQTKANTNQDRFISTQEWAEVYKVVRPEITYDSRNPPSDLSTEEMERYLGEVKIK